MSGQPTKFQRVTNYTDFSASNPSRQQPGAYLDAEFDGVKETTDQTIDRLALIQRDDGKLGSQSVGMDQLAPDAIAYLGATGSADVIAAINEAGAVATDAKDGAVAAQAATEEVRPLLASKTISDLSAITLPDDIAAISIAGAAAIGDGSAGMQLVYDETVDEGYVAANPETSFLDAAGRGFRQARRKASDVDADDGKDVQYNINAIPFVTPKQRGASATIDSTQALIDTLSEGRTNGSPIFLNQTIRIDTAVDVAGDIDIRGPGFIDLSSGTGTLQFGTGVTVLPDLAADIPLHSSAATFVDDHGLAIGDVFEVWNPTDHSQAPNITASNRSVYRAGDMFMVSEVVSSSQVNFFGTAREAFAAADVKCFKSNAGRLSWQGVGIIPPPTGDPVIRLDGLIGVNLDRLNLLVGCAGTAVELFRCYNSRVIAPRIMNLSGADGYPIIISNSQRGILDGLDEIGSAWHCAAFGGRDGDATVPSADWLIVNSLASNKAAPGIGSLETHGGCKRITFDGFMTDGINVGGSDITFRNGVVYGRDPSLFADGNCIDGTELVGGRIAFENIRAISAGNGSSFASHLHLDVSMRSKPIRIFGKNLDFENIGTGSATARVAYIGNGAAPAYIDGDSGKGVAPIDVHFDGFDYTAPSSPVALIGFNGTQDVSAVTSIQIDNFKGPLDTFLAATNSANLNVTYSGTLRKDVAGYTSHGQNNVTLSADRVRTAAIFMTKTHVWDSAFGANRTVTLDATRVRTGDTFRIIRTGGDTGGPWTLSVGGLVTLSQSDWCEVTYTGSAWIVSAKGSLT